MLQPTGPVPTSSTVQIAPIRCTTMVCRGNTAPGFGDVFAAAQIGMEGESRQSTTANVPTAPANTGLSLPLMASSMTAN